MTTRRTTCTRREAMRALGVFAAGATLPGWLAACGRGASQPVPPEIAIDEDTCDWCRMTIDDPRLVAAFVPASGRPLRFGEPGCLLAWLAEHPGAEGAAFVVAQEDAQWLAAPSATFAHGLVRTPMRFDLVAWRGDPPRDDGERFTWAELLKQGKPHALQD